MEEDIYEIFEKYNSICGGRGPLICPSYLRKKKT